MASVLITLERSMNVSLLDRYKGSCFGVIKHHLHATKQKNKKEPPEEDFYKCLSLFQVEPDDMVLMYLYMGNKKYLFTTV